MVGARGQGRARACAGFVECAQKLLTQSMGLATSWCIFARLEKKSIGIYEGLRAKKHFDKDVKARGVRDGEGRGERRRETRAT